MKTISTFRSLTPSDSLMSPLNDLKKFLSSSGENGTTPNGVHTSILAAQLAFESVHWWSNVVRYLQTYVVLPHSPNATTRPARGKYIDCPERIPFLNCSPEYAEYLRKYAPTAAEIAALSDIHNRLLIAGNDIVFWHYIRCNPQLQHPFWQGLFDAYELDRQYICQVRDNVCFNEPSPNALRGLSDINETFRYATCMQTPAWQNPDDIYAYSNPMDATEPSPSGKPAPKNRLMDTENRPDTYGCGLVYSLLVEIHRLQGTLDEFIQIPKEKLAFFIAYTCKAKQGTMSSYLPINTTKELRPSDATIHYLESLLESVGIDNVVFTYNRKDENSGILSQLLYDKQREQSA